MNQLDPSDAVRKRAIVAAHTAVPVGGQEVIQGFGRIVAYNDTPTYLIEKPDGTRFSWRADLTRPATAPELAQMLHDALDSHRDESQ